MCECYKLEEVKKNRNIINQIFGEFSTEQKTGKKCEQIYEEKIPKHKKKEKGDLIQSLNLYKCVVLSEFIDNNRLPYKFSYSRAIKVAEKGIKDLDEVVLSVFYYVKSYQVEIDEIIYHLVLEGKKLKEKTKCQNSKWDCEKDKDSEQEKESNKKDKEKRKEFEKDIVKNKDLLFCPSYFTQCCKSWIIIEPMFFQLIIDGDPYVFLTYVVANLPYFSRIGKKKTKRKNSNISLQDTRNHIMKKLEECKNNIDEENKNKIKEKFEEIFQTLEEKFNINEPAHIAMIVVVQGLYEMSGGKFRAKNLLPAFKFLLKKQEKNLGGSWKTIFSNLLDSKANSALNFCELIKHIDDLETRIENVLEESRKKVLSVENSFFGDEGGVSFIDKISFGKWRKGLEEEEDRNRRIDMGKLISNQIKEKLKRQKPKESFDIKVTIENKKTLYRLEKIKKEGNIIIYSCLGKINSQFRELVKFKVLLDEKGFIEKIMII